MDGLKALDDERGRHHEDDRCRHGHEVVMPADELEVLSPRHEEKRDFGDLQSHKE